MAVSFIGGGNRSLGDILCLLRFLLFLLHHPDCCRVMYCYSTFLFHYYYSSTHFCQLDFSEMPWSNFMKPCMNIIYYLGTPVFSINKTDCHDVTVILLKVALNTINHQYHIICLQNIYDNQFHCNIIFLIKIFLENVFNFTFQRSTNDQS